MNTLFYFLLASTAVLATTANASEPVVDADGDLISDGSYYAVPVSDNEEQGSCPKILKLGSSYWWLTETQSKGLLFIAAGPKPETGKDSSKSFFQIKKAGDFLSGYKFVYCRNDKSCYEFGMVVDRYGYNRLAPANLPFLVEFVKAVKTETSSKSKTETSLKTTKFRG
ncbi:BnaAnng20070D [Brassica napus]|uniref:BnaAnng20070D protein n=1 Tax=Brassica napus TaxID=3708 RepID=A0A078JBT3_BRANA|nr:BnaAnng20070D [Brassica napus]